MFIFLAWVLLILIGLTCGSVVIGLTEEKENGTKTYPLKTAFVFVTWLMLMFAILHEMNRFYGVG